MSNEPQLRAFLARWNPATVTVLLATCVLFSFLSYAPDGAYHILGVDIDFEMDSITRWIFGIPTALFDFIAVSTVCGIVRDLFRMLAGRGIATVEETEARNERMQARFFSAITSTVREPGVSPGAALPSSAQAGTVPTALVSVAHFGVFVFIGGLVLFVVLVIARFMIGALISLGLIGAVVTVAVKQNRSGRLLQDQDNFGSGGRI